MCLVLIILITARTAQDCLNSEPGQLNSSLRAARSCGCCEQVGREVSGGVRRCQESDCGSGLSSESHMLFQDDHRTTKICKGVTLLLLGVFFVIFNASLPDVLSCHLMSLLCSKWMIHRDPLSTVDSAWHSHPENRWDNALICRCTTCQAQPESRYLPLVLPEQLLGALMGISADKDYGEAADLFWSLSLGLL